MSAEGQKDKTWSLRIVVQHAATCPLRHVRAHKHTHTPHHTTHCPMRSKTRSIYVIPTERVSHPYSPHLNRAGGKLVSHHRHFAGNRTLAIVTQEKYFKTGHGQTSLHDYQFDIQQQYHSSVLCILSYKKKLDKV